MREVPTNISYFLESFFDYTVKSTTTFKDSLILKYTTRNSTFKVT